MRTNKQQLQTLSVAARAATAKLRTAKPKARWAAQKQVFAARKAARQALHALLTADGKSYTPAQWVRAKRAAKLV